MLLLSASDGTVSIPLRLLATRAGLSVTQCRRALKRLVATNLVEVAEPGQGTRPTKYRLRWNLQSFPQACVPSPSYFPSVTEKKNLQSKTIARPGGAAWSELPIQNKTSALRWAMFRIRREIAGWGLPPPRRERLIRAVGAAVWRAIRRGLVWTTAQLRRLVAGVILRLREDAPAGISLDLKRACGFAGWCVASSLRELRPVRAGGGDLRGGSHGSMAAEVERWRSEAEEERGLKAFLEQADVTSLTGYIRRIVAIKELAEICRPFAGLEGKS